MWKKSRVITLFLYISSIVFFSPAWWDKSVCVPGTSETAFPENQLYFSVDEMAKYDAPAVIDKALQLNGARSLYWIAHSQVCPYLLSFLYFIYFVFFLSVSTCYEKKILEIRELFGFSRALWSDSWCWRISPSTIKRYVCFLCVGPSKRMYCSFFNVFFFFNLIIVTTLGPRPLPTRHCGHNALREGYCQNDH